jgi:hypothetical protein
MTKFIGVKPYNGWVAEVYVPGGNPKRLEGIYGFALDAAICRNYWIAHWDEAGGADYNRGNNRFNVIPEGENWHD